VKAPRRRGFTLLELLVVMAITLILATLLIAYLRPIAVNQSQKTATRAVIQQCQLAIGAYKAEFGALPKDLQTLLRPNSKTVTTGDASDPRNTRVVTFPPFLVLPDEQISSETKDILDAWGDPLHYDPTRAQGLVWSDHLKE
jgi:prepilin-type N-terminal cleavage/methylation domain-containing protein